MQVVKLDSIEHFNKELRRCVEDRSAIVIVKGVLGSRDCDKIIDQAMAWRRTYDAASEATIASGRLLNAHLSLNHVRENQATPENIDFKENRTNIEAHNYRIGDWSDSMIKEKMETLCEIKPELFDLFERIQGTTKFTSGDSKLNLFLELVHFPVGSGFVETHSHETMVRNGLKLNVLGLLSRLGQDYSTGGVVFQKAGQGKIDLDADFTKGDVIIFHNSLPHYVKPIAGRGSTGRGRWILTFFYY